MPKYLNDSGLEYAIGEILTKASDYGITVGRNSNKDYNIDLPNNLRIRILRQQVTSSTAWSSMGAGMPAYYTNTVTISSVNFSSVIAAFATLNGAGSNIPIGASVVPLSNTQFKYYLTKNSTTGVNIDFSLMIVGVRA